MVTEAELQTRSMMFVKLLEITVCLLAVVKNRNTKFNLFFLVEPSLEGQERLIKVSFLKFSEFILLKI